MPSHLVFRFAAGVALAICIAVVMSLFVLCFIEMKSYSDYKLEKFKAELRSSNIEVSRKKN